MAAVAYTAFGLPNLARDAHVSECAALPLLCADGCSACGWCDCALSNTLYMTGGTGRVLISCRVCLACTAHPGEYDEGAGHGDARESNSGSQYVAPPVVRRPQILHPLSSSFLSHIHLHFQCYKQSMNILWRVIFGAVANNLLHALALILSAEMPVMTLQRCSIAAGR
jgi:hypothetical protein